MRMCRASNSSASPSASMGWRSTTSMTGQPWCAIPAGICATLLAIGAITGWCPTDLLRTPQAETVEQNTLGFTDARQHIDIT